MKKAIWTRIALALLMVAMILAVVSCKGDKDPETTSGSEEVTTEGTTQTTVTTAQPDYYDDIVDDVIEDIFA